MERRLERTSRQKKSGDKEIVKEHEALLKLREGLAEGIPARRIGLSEEERERVRHLNLLTFKKVLYAANVGEADVVDPDANPHVRTVRRIAEAEGAGVIPICARLEAEIAELQEEDRRQFLEELGLKATGLDRLVAAAYGFGADHLLYRRREGGPRLDDRGGPRPPGGGRDPFRL